MNLFVEELLAHIKGEWDRALSDAGGTRESRFICQSLDPAVTFALFAALDEHRLHWLKEHQIECHFRVATGLWEDWCKTHPESDLDQQMAALGALGPNGARLWIDEEDRLTWYRSRTRAPGSDGLVVVLVGLDHATDQGGLIDFHCVDEARLWQFMERGFESWASRLRDRLALDAAGSENLDLVLRELFMVRPLRLGRLADFLECQVIAGQPLASLQDVLEGVCAALPAWGIPPLLTVTGGGALKGKKSAAALKDADAFISHRRYKTASGQKKDWDKIATWFADPDFELPTTLDGAPAYADADDYRETLHAFIYEADADARERLLQTDAVPLLRVLKQRVKPDGEEKEKKETVKSLSGNSFEVLLQAVWLTLERLAKAAHGRDLAEVLKEVRIELISFAHDLHADGDDGAGDQARDLLRGCLGGLEAVFEDMDWRLPRDADQALLPSRQWDLKVPLTLTLGLNTIKLGVGRSRPAIQFKVLVGSQDGHLDQQAVFKWVFGATQPERVRYRCAQEVLKLWDQAAHPARVLPAWRIQSELMTALYFAADGDEAQRLLGQALTALASFDLMTGLPTDQLDPALRTLTGQLIAAYRDWLTCAVAAGYYEAQRRHLVAVLNAYEQLAVAVLDPRRLGSTELLRRFYKAFLVVDETVGANDHTLPVALAWGLSPALLELTQAQVWYLQNGFPEAVAELSGGRDGKSLFRRLFALAEIQRPLAALVDQHRHLSAEIKSFGLLHYLGAAPATGKSLAVQTLLRDDEGADAGRVSQILTVSDPRQEERALVVRVLDEYLALYPFAQDGLRILAVNVKELATILAGVDTFLKTYLDESRDDWPAFHCTVTVYSTAASPLAMENRLALWRNEVMEKHREAGRPLILGVGHRYAPKVKVADLLKREARLYDLAFLFHFLQGDLQGDADPADAFEYHFNDWCGGQFPIGDYPRPTRSGDPQRRQSLLSSRRLRIQTRHADLSARLVNPGSANRDHVIFGQIDYGPWAEIVAALHRKAQWVACIDPFVDKRLISGADASPARKIVGFASGLGAYGELNLTISTEQDTLKSLSALVVDRLTEILPHAASAGFEAMAVRVVNEAEEVIGLASLRAVVGDGEKVREVIGFAAIRRALAEPQTQPAAAMCQLLPVDSLQHWFDGAAIDLRPDLLQLSLQLRDDDIPLVRAVLVECKLGLRNPARLAHALEQVQEGLSHLTQLLAPSRGDLRRPGFDRRYWWAQLHRALTSRAVVTLPESHWRALDSALEGLAEGTFEIRWQAAVFTFWTDEAGPVPDLTPYVLPAGTVQPPFAVPPDFAITHVALGYEGLAALFAETRPAPLLTLGETAIRLRPSESAAGSASTAAAAAGSAPGGAPPAASDPAPVTPAAPPPTAVTSPADPDPMVPTVTLAPPVAPEIQPTSPPTPEATPAVPAAGPTRPVDPPAVPGGRGQWSQVPEKILIGTSGNGTEPVYWHFGHPQLPNRHILIFGYPGSGKTYAIQCLLAEMAHQRLRSLIIDYTDGFLPGQMEPHFAEVAAPKSHYVMTDGLPLAPFRRQRQEIDPSQPPREEQPYEVATRIQSIFASIFTMGDQQTAALIRAIETGIEEDPEFRLRNLPLRLRDGTLHGESLANKLEPLIRAEPFREGESPNWEAVLGASAHWVQILQLKGRAREIQKMVTEFVLWDLYDYACNTGSKHRPIPIVLDEIQNLNHRSDSPIDKMLREGRKFGLAMMLATQTASNFTQDQRGRLFLAGHKLFFKPATTEVGFFAQLLAEATGVSKSDWAERLSRLEKGQCYSLGWALTSSGALKERAVLVSITPLEQRVLGGTNG